MLVRQFEKELKLINSREVIKKELLKREDFVKAKVFVEISNDKNEIELNDFVNFLQKHKFYAGRDDLEAILRRVDHTGNQKIDFEEFCEATSVNERNLSPEEAEEELSVQKSSPGKKALEKDVIETEQKITRSNSRQDVVEDSLE